MDIDIRQLDRSDMGDAARVHRAAFDDRLPHLAGRHTPAEDLAYFEHHVFTDCEVFGAWEGERLLAFIAIRDWWIDQLYVSPEHQGEGLGSHLLDVAKARQTELRLWTFQRNLPARAFYEARGFELIERTDGARNDEQEPDALYLWRRRTPPVVKAV